jgi:hypothetical protein
MPINKDACYGDCLCKGETFLRMRVSEARRSLRQRLPVSPLPTPDLW